MYYFFSVVGAPIGIAGASFTLIFFLTTRIIKKLLSITRNKKKKHDKILMLAKSKLNSIETLISQALIDMEISHEEFVTILKEKDKYEKMKENLRNENEKQEIMRLSSIRLSKKQSKIIEHLRHQKFLFFFLCMYKMVQISKEGYEKREVEIIGKGR